MAERIKKLKAKIKKTKSDAKRQRALNRNPEVKTVLNVREFGDGYIRTTTDTYYFLAEYPKNEKLLTKKERQAIKKQKARLYNNFDNIIKFSTDLPYSLEENRASLKSKKTADEVRNELLEFMVDTVDTLEEQNENSIKRFYYVFRDSDNINMNIVRGHFEENNIRVFIPSQRELEQMYRSYTLRDDNVHHVMYYGFDEYIDTFLPAQIKPYQDILFLGGKYRKVIFVKNYPTPLRDFHLAKLSAFKGVNVTIRATEKKSNSMVDDIVKTKTKNNMLLLEGSIKSKMFAGYNDKYIDGLYDYMQDTQQKMFDVSMFLEIVADTREEVIKKELEIGTALNGITTETINNNTMNLFRSASPLHAFPLKFIKRNMPSESLACLNDANYSGRLKKDGIFLGTDESGGLIFVDFYERTEDITNGHFIVIADSGQGKSYLCKKILTGNYAIGFDVISMDNDREYEDPCENVKGTNVDVLAGDYIINPLEIRMFGTFDDVLQETKGTSEHAELAQIFKKYPTFNSKNVVSQHVGWLRDYFKLVDNELTNEHLDILEYFLLQFYAYWGITEDTDLRAYTSDMYPIFSDFFEYLLQVEKLVKKDDRLSQAIPKEKVNKLILTVNVLANGSLAPLNNGHTKVKIGKWLNIILQDLLDKYETQKDLFLFNFLGFVWSEQVKRKKPLIFFTDEMYLLVNKDIPIILDYYKMFVKRGRKIELYFGGATQNLLDFNDPEILTMTQPLFSIPKHKFIGFPGENELSLLKTMLNLTQGEIDTISIPQQKHFLLIAGKEKYKLVVAGAPEENSMREDKYKLAYERVLFGKAGGRGVGE